MGFSLTLTLSPSGLGVRISHIFQCPEFVGESESVSVFVFEGGLGTACSVRNRMAELVGQIRATTRNSPRDGVAEGEGLASH